MGAFIPNVDLTVIKKFFGGVEGPGAFVVGDTISPILEIQDIALFQRRDLVETTVNVSAIGGVIGQVVDPGEFWLVHYVGIITDVLDADQTITMQLFVEEPAARARIRLLVPTSIGNSEQGGIGAAFGRPLILRSGTRFGAAANAITIGAAGNVAVELAANISRVRT